MNLRTVEHLPPLVRGGGKRQSQETKEIIEALLSGSVTVMDDIEPGNIYNARQQRVRSAAKAAGLKVTIRYKEDEKAIYFQGKGPIVVEETAEPEVATPAATGSKGKTKVTATN